MRSLFRLLIALVLLGAGGLLRAQEVGRLDALLRLAQEDPPRALQQLQALPASGAQRAWVEAWLLQLAGREDEALRRLPVDQAQGIAGGLLRAQAAQQRGSHALAAEYALKAVQSLSQCGDCDLRLRFQAHWLHAETLETLGDDGAALRALTEALALAEQLGDVHRQAACLSAQAPLQQSRGDLAGARVSLSKALALTGLDAAVEGRIWVAAAWVARMEKDWAGQREALEKALRLASDAPRLEALVRVNLGDHWLHQGQPRNARAVIEAVLTHPDPLQDAALVRVARHNLAVALIQLREFAAARQQVALVEASSAKAAVRDRLFFLDELSTAWAQVGQWREALRLRRAERELAAEFNERQLALVLDEQRQGQVAAEQRSELQLLQERRALQERQAANQRALHWIGWLAALLLLLGLVIAFLLWAGSRVVHGRLERSRQQLQGLADHDPLTGLCNRHALQKAMAGREPARSGEGGWALLDIDHFKRLNDTHGHAAGDQVLQAVAKRLAAQVRDEDLLMRWGGEEFLLHAPGIPFAGMRHLAMRLMRAVSSDPVALDSGLKVPISASVGFLALPLPDQAQPFDWERAVNWADLALYTAKNAGRACAVGVVGAALADERALAQIEADFEGAVHAARVQVVQLRSLEGGPA